MKKWTWVLIIGDIGLNELWVILLCAITVVVSTLVVESSGGSMAVKPIEKPSLLTIWSVLNSSIAVLVVVTIGSGLSSPQNVPSVSKFPSSTVRLSYLQNWSYSRAKNINTNSITFKCNMGAKLCIVYRLIFTCNYHQRTDPHDAFITTLLCVLTLTSTCWRCFLKMTYLIKQPLIKYFLLKKQYHMPKHRKFIT